MSKHSNTKARIEKKFSKTAKELLIALFPCLAGNEFSLETVTLTLQVSNLGSWGPDCQMEQIYRQAITEAKNRIAKALSGRDIKCIGEPVVRAITTDMEQRP